jgi:hypothetical protein
MRLRILTASAVFAMGLAPFAFAQRGLNPIGNNGNILNPGTPLSGPSPVVNGPAFGSLPALGPLPTVGPLPPVVNGFASSGFGNATAPRGSGRRGNGRANSGASYVGVPVFGSAGGVFSPPPGQYDPIFGVYNPGVQYQPSDSDYSAQQQPTPTVIINQYFQPQTAHPVFHDYTNVPLPPPGRGVAPNSRTYAPPPDGPSGNDAASAGNSEQPIFLIAMKDHTIYPALAFWIDGDTLNYVTMQGTPNRVSLSLVDRELSLRLNDERGLAFKLPATQ